VWTTLLSMCLLSSPTTPRYQDFAPPVRVLGKVNLSCPIDSYTDVFLDGEPTSLQRLPEGCELLRVEMSRDLRRVRKIFFKSPP
jgi:hypothetical protein